MTNEEQADVDDIVQRHNDLLNAVVAHLASPAPAQLPGTPGRLLLRSGYRVEARARYQLLRPTDGFSEIVFEGALHECLAKARECGALEP